MCYWIVIVVVGALGLFYWTAVVVDGKHKFKGTFYGGCVGCGWILRRDIVQWMIELAVAFIFL